MNTLHICKGEQVQVGDKLILRGAYYTIMHIEDERFGRQVELRDGSGYSRSRFITNDEIVTIAL